MAATLRVVVVQGIEFHLHALCSSCLRRTCLGFSVFFSVLLYTVHFTDLSIAFIQQLF